MDFLRSVYVMCPGGVEQIIWEEILRKYASCLEY